MSKRKRRGRGGGATPNEMIRDVEAQRRQRLVSQLVAKLNRRLKKNQRIPFVLVCVDPVEVTKPDPKDPKKKVRVVEQHIKVASLRLEEPGGEHLVNVLLDHLSKHNRLPGQSEEQKYEEPNTNLDG